MKSLIHTLLFSCCWLFSLGQTGYFNFQQTGDTLITGLSGEILIASEGILSNNSSEETEILLIKEVNHLPEGWASAMCTEQCAAPTTDTLYLALDPGESQAFTMYFYTNSGPDTGFVMMKFLNLNDPSGNFYRQGYIGQSFISTSLETVEESTVLVYPNPAQHQVWIESDRLEPGTRATIWSINGQFIQEIEVQSNPFPILTYPLKSNGWYLIQLQLPNEERITKMIQIRRD
ncbi:MAG: T9SS type A sorting domain-containing protein [Bacteroidota bacterium]